MPTLDSFHSQADLTLPDGRVVRYHRIDAVPGADRLPYALRVLVENLLRREDGRTVTRDQIQALGAWDPAAAPATEIEFAPARVLMQDFTGVPCVVDLATMREAMADLGGDPAVIEPQVPAELVIDHSVIVEQAGTPDAWARNTEIEYRRNRERYQFLRWGQSAFGSLRVVPPETGIVHQVNLERLARGVMETPLPAGGAADAGQPGPARSVAFPDTCVGTDSHTTMIGGLGVLGWGVGGIEAEAAMLGQPISMLIPQVVGFELTGALKEPATATDAVLRITEMLRGLGVVGKFVEFYGPGVAALPLAHRATISNMSPEFGSTCAIFPIDQVTVDYYRLTGRPEARVALIEAYAKAQGLWGGTPGAAYSAHLALDLGTVEPAIAGPKRPQDRIPLRLAQETFRRDLPAYQPQDGHADAAGPGTLRTAPVRLPDGRAFELRDGAVVVAAITSCTNTSNPSVMLAAGLLAQRAHQLGLTPKPWVKTSLAPGSRVVTAYLQRAGLTGALDALGFNLVGYGCTTCIGNSGPLAPEISEAINSQGLACTAVLSGNRNFEGRISPDVAMNYLASPPLVVAYALAGTLDFDFETDPLGTDPAGAPVFLRDIWPSAQAVAAAEAAAIGPGEFTTAYATVFDGDANWQALPTPSGAVFSWDPASTYVRKAPYFDGMSARPAPPADIVGARVLAKLGDSVTTDHISPAGAIKPDSPAGLYLAGSGVARGDFNSYGSRRGNHEVMVRGTFANIRLRNQLVDVAGGLTRNLMTGAVESIYDAARAYRAAGVPLVVLGGKEYGSGSSRDWAAKGTALLGVRAVLAESFERIHRSNLIGMGVLPLEYVGGQTAATLGLDGTETFAVDGIARLFAEPWGTGGRPMPERTLRVTASRADGSAIGFDALARVDTPGEADYYRHGGILQYVLRDLAGLA